MGVRRLERSARRALVRLYNQLGSTGLAAVASAPGLAAVVDQHAAAVRDILVAGMASSAPVPDDVLLAGYARGVEDHMRERGLQLPVPADTASWLTATWYHVRLLAVCSLAKNPNQHQPVAGLV